MEERTRKEMLIGRIDRSGLGAGDFDEDVHDAAGRHASIVNNGGIDDQMDYLIGMLGIGGVEALVEEKLRPPRRDTPGSR